MDWHDGVIAAPAPASDDEVRQAERALRVRLPPDFLVVARAHQGAAPEPAGIDLPDGSATAVAHLLHFSESAPLSHIVHRAWPLAGVLQKGVIPFAEDVGGDLFCFNYRKTPEQPSVVFWSVDTGAVPLAESFTAFTELLRA